MDPDNQALSTRIDLWLWHARFAKTRALAAEMVSKKRVRITRHGHQHRLEKPSRTVQVGDEVIFVISGRVTHVRVLQIAQRRGPFSEARALYEDLSPPIDDAPSPI